jgi:hypothetical protein
MKRLLEVIQTIFLLLKRLFLSFSFASVYVCVIHMHTVLLLPGILGGL